MNLLDGGNGPINENHTWLGDGRKLPYLDLLEVGQQWVSLEQSERTYLERQHTVRGSLELSNIA